MRAIQGTGKELIFPREKQFYEPCLGAYRCVGQQDSSGMASDILKVGGVGSVFSFIGFVCKIKRRREESLNSCPSSFVRAVLNPK